MPDDNVTAPAPTDTVAPTLPPVDATAVPDVPAPNVPDAPVPNAPAPEVEAPSADTNASGGAIASDAVVVPTVPEAVADATNQAVVDTETPAEVVRKIGEAHNVLVALSSDPSVDEMAAAIGLSLYLDRLGKRATAIYSGQTPNALEFLKPEETFEDSADTLQDFVIALNKEKADHLRYKLDGDYVKIYITPYKSRISEEDLGFSYGDYNVDLVLALDVANGVDLDAALREHGRIMHDAVIVNITTGNPGRLGEIEWSDKSASSVSEMIARLLYSVNSKIKIEKEEATAFLTGIVAATNRFSNAGTTSETMKLASKLMESGANQQLVSKNITPDVENELFGMPGMKIEEKNTDGDPTKLDIQHGNEKDVDESKVVSDTVTEKESTLLDDLKAAEASLAAAETEVAPEAEKKPLEIDNETKTDTLPEMAKVADAVKEEVARDADMIAKAEEGTETTNVAEPEVVDTEANVENVENVENPSSDFISDKPEKVIQPPESMDDMTSGGETEKYGQMLEDALASVNDGAVTVPTQIDNPTPVDNMVPVGNPAEASAPTVASNPEINGVPEINYMPMPGEEVLPPPPAPPIDMNAPAPEVAEGPETTVAPTEVVTPLSAQPAMQDQIYNAPANDPGAFKIPGV